MGGCGGQHAIEISCTGGEIAILYFMCEYRKVGVVGSMQ